MNDSGRDCDPGLRTVAEKAHRRNLLDRGAQRTADKLCNLWHQIRIRGEGCDGSGSARLEPPCLQKMHIIHAQSLGVRCFFSTKGHMIAMCLPETKKSSPTRATCRFLKVEEYYIITFKNDVSHMSRLCFLQPLPPCFSDALRGATWSPQAPYLVQV